jgi:SNF2 family DNA or RNA helicase
MRIACSGGKVPLYEDEDEIENGDEEDDVEMDYDGDNDDHVKGAKKKRATKEKKFSDFAFTSKLQSLIHELKNIRQKDNTSKCLVFSQFQSTLNWLKEELPEHGFQYRCLSGEMTMSQRAKALRDFQNDPPTTIFLLSMRYVVSMVDHWSYYFKKKHNVLTNILSFVSALELWVST